MNQRSSPPLYTWFASAILVVGVLAWSYAFPAPYSFHKKERPLLHLHDCLDHLTENWPFDTAQYKVVIWGSSLSCQGIRHQDYFQRVLAAGGKEGVLVQKMYMLNSHSRDLPHLERLFKVTASIQPDLLLIEDHLSVYKVSNASSFKYLQEFRKSMDHQFSKWPSPVRPLRKPPFFDAHNQRLLRVSQPDTSNIGTSGRIINKIDDTALLREQLIRYGLDKIPMIVLNIPRPGAIESQHLNENNLAKIDTLLSDYQAIGFDLTYWKFPEPLPFRYYSDHAHLNLDGRDLYSKWLGNQLLNYLNN